MATESAQPDPTRKAFGETMAAPVGSPGGSPAETTAFDASAFSSLAEDGQSTPPASERMPETFGRYRVVKLLGRGGMGSVFLAHDTQLDRPVALKIPRLDNDKSGKLVTRFMREARAVALLNHPNICPVFDVGELEGHHFLAMAYIKGKPLAAFLETGGPQPERGIALTIYKIALALQEAHANGILHRDLKPANVMVDSRGEPIVMDFGLSHRLNDEDQSRLTQEGTVIGTPAYMAPEQIDGRSPIGPATDVYSLGVVLYELLTGRCPYEGSMVSVIGKVLHSTPTPVAELRGDVSPALAAICEQAMAKDIADRYPTMKDFAAALAGYLKGRTTVVATKPIPKPQLDGARDRQAIGDVSSLEELLTSAEAATVGGAASSLLTVPRERTSMTSQLWFMIPAGLGICVLVSVMALAFWPGAKPQVALNVPQAAPAADVIPRIERKASPIIAADEPGASEPPKDEPNQTPPPVAIETEPPADTNSPSAADEQETDDERNELPSPPDDEAESQNPPRPFRQDDDRPETDSDRPPKKSTESKLAEKFKQLDRNHDGELDPGEIHLHVIMRADQNKDDRVTLEELDKAYERLKERLFAPPNPATLKRLQRKGPRGPGGPGPGGGPGGGPPGPPRR